MPTTATASLVTGASNTATIPTKKGPKPPRRPAGRGARHAIKPGQRNEVALTSGAEGGEVCSLLQADFAFQSAASDTRVSSTRGEGQEMQKNEVDEAAALVDGGPHGHLSVFQVGDYVAHRDSPRFVFKVVEILEAVPAKLGDHLLACVLEQDVRKYHERDLVRVDLEPEDQW